MRIQNIPNVNFGAKYRTLTSNTPKQVEQIYNQVIINRQNALEQQKLVVEKETKRMQEMQDKLNKTVSSRNLTLDAMHYMRFAQVQNQIAKLPKQDEIVLHTPDYDGGDYTQVPYLTYVEGKKGLFSKSINFNDESFMSCYFDDEDSNFSAQQVTNWLRLISELK